MSSDALRDCALAPGLAERLRAERVPLTRRWLERITARLSLDPNHVFPTDRLLDHVPLLIDGIADHVEHRDHEIGADAAVVAKAMELGKLRHEQGHDAYEILKEYELLGGVLFAFVAEEARALPGYGGEGDLLACGHRLFHAIAVIQQSTTTHFLRLAEERVREREERLRAFNRTVSHEIKNRIGAVLGASEVLRELGDLPPAERDRFLDIISGNAHAMRRTIENLVALSRLDPDARQHRHVQLPEAAREVTRQLRDVAQSAGVEVRLAPDLPAVEVNAAAVELCLTNYVSNAIKYADPERPSRLVEVTGALEPRGEGDEPGDAPCELVVRVRDNGLGVPAAQRQRLFERFFRAHDTVTGAEGTGLGLSIVRETVETLGGRAWAEFPEDGHGSVFVFSLPCEPTPADDASTADGDGEATASASTTVGERG